MTTTTWANRELFVNCLLSVAVSYADLDWDDTELDGVAGNQFDEAIKGASESRDQRNEYIKLAIKLGVPVEGLKADGEFGDKWNQVVELCKTRVAAS
jgi:hypothetical protein